LEKYGREHLGITKLDDWYSVKTGTEFKKVFRRIYYYYGSLYNTLKTLYPHHKWDALRFSRLPAEYKQDEDAQKDAFERIGREKLGIKKLDDWYNVSILKACKELTFVKNFRDFFDCLKRFYPQHNWDPLRFSRVPYRTWPDENMQRDALERVGREKLGIRELDDWYNVYAVDVRRELSFMNYGTLFGALKKLYPHHDWDILSFQRLPSNFWKDENTAKYYHELFTQWKKIYDIRSVSDWYQLPPKQLMQLKRVSMGLFGSTLKMIEKWFPEILWRCQFTSQIELQVKFFGANLHGVTNCVFLCRAS
jgi:hypothetical protein